MTGRRDWTRRDFLKATGVAGAGIAGSGVPFARSAEGAPAPQLDPASIPKYKARVVVPGQMPRKSVITVGGKQVDYYEVAVRQFKQQMLPPGMASTSVWGYGTPRYPATFHAPTYSIEARANRPVRVRWMNQLLDCCGNYLPHLLPVDQTLHWANPPGGVMHRDTRPEFEETPGPYTGPVPIVTHVHGAHTHQEADGYPEAWYLPPAKNIPAGYAKVGTWYEPFEDVYGAKYGSEWATGSANFQYPNNQRATSLWFHDHTLGMTRLNVYAGPAGFYFIRGGASDIQAPGAATPLPGPAPYWGMGTRPAYEIPLAIQDRSFRTDGSLFYPDSRAFFDGYTGPYIPETDVPPMWNPEFFGDTMIVNGRTWPTMYVEPRRYRFRLLNGCQSRFLILKLTSGSPSATRPVSPSKSFWQIGAEGGFLAKPVQLPMLLMGPAERADVIVDFSGMPVGRTMYLINEGPDEPFGGGVGDPGFPYANPGTTGQVMKFVVKEKVGTDKSVRPALLDLPDPPSLPPSVRRRRLSLNEHAHDPMGGTFDGPVAALLGVVADGKPVPKMWMEPITESPRLGDTEIWELHNFTVDAHPIHVHQVMFQVLNRQPFSVDGEGRVVLDGTARPPEKWEQGPTKDTVIAYPGEVTRIKMKFDIRGLYVWHCHILEHEDNEMMRPYRVR